MPVLDSSLSLPSAAALGTTISMVVTVTNVHERPITLEQISIDNSFLNGFQVLDVQPEPEVSPDTFLTRDWIVHKSVSQGETFSVEFTLKPVQEGHYSGSVQVCNKTAILRFPCWDSTTLVADVVVAEQEMKGEISVEEKPALLEDDHLGFPGNVSLSSEDNSIKHQCRIVQTSRSGQLNGFIVANYE